MTQLLILSLAFLMVAVSTIKAFAKKVYREATYKASEFSKKGGDNE